MPWSNYKGRSAGRVIQGIYLICGLHIGEHVQIGCGDVTLYQEPFATYTWDGDTPVFTFVGANKESYQQIQRLLK